MSKRAQENIVASLFLFFFIAMIIISFDYGPRARMVPVPIAAVSAIIMLLQMYLMNFRKEIELNVDVAELLTRGQSSGAMLDEVKQVDEVKITVIKGGKESTALLIVVLYFVMTILIGILPAMILFVYGFFALITKVHWIKSLITTLITVASIYILFVYVLEIQFYEGWLVNTFLG